MKTLYLDCAMGAAGDMLAAALLELFAQPQAVIDELNALGIPGVVYTAESSLRCGIMGTHLRVTVNGESEHPGEHHHAHEHAHEHEHAHTHAHSDLHTIVHILEHLPLEDSVRADVSAVYTLLAQAESHAHGVPVDEIHFHEVGTMDAVADITAVCLMMKKLAPEQVIVSPVCVGSGQVHCAHGILPVPAPATAYLLRGIPIYSGSVASELCTPTGAALLRQFATAYGAMPVLRVQAIGYGMGQKEFAAANCVRALLGQTQDESSDIAELCCNVDDMTGEAIGFAMQALYDGGALEVFTVPIGMKKSRPGTLLCVLCPMQLREQLVHLLLKHTTTLGVREHSCRRYTMRRSVADVQTPFGTVRKKTSDGYGVHREKYEYEDVAHIANERDMSLFDALAAIKHSDAGN